MVPIKYSPNGEYTHRDFLTCLIDYATKNVSWRKYKGTIDCPIDGRYLNAIHNIYTTKISGELLTPNKYLPARILFS